VSKSKPTSSKAGNAKGRSGGSRSRRRSPGLLRRFWFWRLAGVGAVLGLAVCAVYSIWAGFYDLEQLKVMPQRTLVYDYRGKPFSRLSGEDRIMVSVDRVSPHFINALLVREDTRFYRHYGVDPIGIARAIVRNLIHFSAREGASTLTQQLARNSFSLGGKNLHRKLLEAFLALRIERHLTKKEILESYVNRIFYGSGYWGIETASRAYFNKSSAELTLSEAAVMAGLIRSPNRFSPFRNPEGAIAQRDTVLGRMAELGYITPAQEAQALKEELVVAKVRPPSAEQSYAMDLVEQELSLILDDDQLAQGGLRVHTSIDPALQKAAQKAVDEHLTEIEARPGYGKMKRADYTTNPADGATPYLQGSVVVLDNATGGIRAVVGGRDFVQSRFNRAFLSPRQVGSTFKPFVYAAAYAAGRVSPGSPISDGRIGRGEIPGAGNWSPGNSDGRFRGVMAAEEGLVLSRNTMSVRVGSRAGLENVRALAERVGLGSVPQFPSIYLGAFEATLKNLTAAYTIFPNRGIRRQTFLIDQVVNPAGRVVYRSARIETRVLDARVAGMVTGGLTKAFQRGTGSGSSFKGAAAGKTGTTNDYRDAWFVGYSRSLTCGVWVGFDKPQKIMDRGYGATLALPIWSEVMQASLGESYDAGKLPEEKPVRRATPVDPLPERVFRSFRDFFRRD